MGIWGMKMAGVELQWLRKISHPSGVVGDLTDNVQGWQCSEFSEFRHQFTMIHQFSDRFTSFSDPQEILNLEGYLHCFALLLLYRFALNSSIITLQNDMMSGRLWPTASNAQFHLSSFIASFFRFQYGKHLLFLRWSSAFNRHTPNLILPPVPSFPQCFRL